MSDAKPNLTVDALPDAAAAHPFEQFLERNFTKLLLGIGLIALVAAGIAAARHFAHETEMEAAVRFTSAKTPEDCDVVVQKYAGTGAAGNALLLKAELLWAAGKKDSSVDALQQFIKEHPNHPLLAHARLALGSKQADMDLKDAARQTLEGVVRDYPKNEAAAAAQTLLGDLLWADGKLDEAKKLFSELPRNFPGSPLIDQVEERTKMIAAALPIKEVDPPPAPPKPAEAPKAPALLTPTAPNITVPTLSAPPVPPTAPMPAPTALTPPVSLVPSAPPVTPNPTTPP
ncbi:MAG: tetratricopeptide repeat protein, partial [Roseimicrobium sp.]